MEFTQEIYEGLQSLPFEIWFLIGAALVFFMQAGFAMVETGFTRAKNAGNIIMKNLMDFCIGTVVFILIGFSIMMAENYVMGIIGVPNMQIFTNWQEFASENGSSFVFNLVFCATAATIVSGAMAERTKFSAYCMYSGIISAVVYPIEAGWVWNSNGWLVQMGFHDFAGSAAIHTVGGVTALIGAAFLGPRIGKYVKDKKTGETIVHAIPGHSITLGALGVFILWFGWYGFNGAAATDGTQLAKIFVTTTIAPAVASCTTMAVTWIKNGKPDVSMTLNGSLAGLVAITAPCSVVGAGSSVIIGIVAGILVVVVVEVLDTKLHIDDPVGAVAVHCANGIWGTIAVGLFANEDLLAMNEASSTGLLMGGGFRQLGIQLLGIICIIVYVVVIMTIVFSLIKKFHGLRVSEEEEVSGLDYTEHGLESAYGGFTFGIDHTYDGTTAEGAAAVPLEESVPVQLVSGTGKASDMKLTEIKILCKEARFEALKSAMNEIGVTGMTVSKVMGCGIQKGKDQYYRGVKMNMDLLPKVQVDIVVAKVPVADVVNAAKKALYTGKIGDGKIFIYDVENAIKVRTGEQGYSAMQGEE